MPDDAGGLISAGDLNRLVDLYLLFEGALDPFSVECKEAEAQFDSLIEKMHREKVLSNYPSLTLSDFRSHARIICRLRVAKQGPPFPYIPR